MALGKKKIPSKTQKRQKVTSGPLNYLFKTGKRAKKGFLALHWSGALAEQSGGQLYLGVSKRLLAKAVDRNRAKRIVREIVRQWLEGEKMNRNILIRLTEKPEILTTPLFRDCLLPLLSKIEKAK